MKDLNRISDNIAHDLKTPLARLRNRLEELNVRLEEDSEYKGDVDFAIEQADQLLSTLNSILRIANIESQADRIRFQTISLASVLSDVIDLYEPIIKDKNITLIQNITEGVDCKGDKDLLFQAFANLIDNAIKHTPERGRISIQLENINNAFSITLTDTGPGIPAEEHDSVFRRFYQIDESRSHPGNGLGLALVKAVMDLHGFNISLMTNSPGLVVSINAKTVTAS